MNLNNVKNEIRHEINSWAGSKEKFTASFIRERVELFFAQAQKQKLYLEVGAGDKEAIIKSLCDDFLGLGPLQKLMDDPEVTEIMVNGPFTVYIEKSGQKVPTEVKFDNEAHLRYIIEKMITASGRRVDESSPFADFSLEDGSRGNVILPPLSVGGATVTIRKFLRSLQKVDDLVRLGTIDARMAEFLVACIKARINILFSGSTGSGKTTTLEVLSSYIDPGERIITIEDALELHLSQKHLVRLLTKASNIEGRGAFSVRDLFRNTLRMRPTRIILGEIRGEEAMDYLQALNSGHRGVLAVIHASSPQDSLIRLETLALYAGLNLPSWTVREQIASGLDLIVQQEQLIDGSRKITYITDIEGLKGDKIVLHDIFRYQVEEITADFKVKGKFKAGGSPKFFNIFKREGIKIDKKIFSD